MVKIKNIEIGEDKLFYKIKDNVRVEEKYIITSNNGGNVVGDILHNSELDDFLKIIFEKLHDLCRYSKIKHSNVCGPNAEHICENVHIRGYDHQNGKIIITEWYKHDSIREKLEIIESVYGSSALTIGTSYHALPYFILTIGDNQFHIAVETTIIKYPEDTYEKPLIYQFYVATTCEELEEILKIRYLCKGINITFDCKKNWIDYMIGGKNKKGTKTRPGTFAKPKTRKSRRLLKNTRKYRR